ncbi:MAG: hypothetical protein P4L33_00880 [Capsulimonadaceae bacterium]|nr:hypothetical protein [Capsulimonadaceae bacterium]
MNKTRLITLAIALLTTTGSTVALAADRDSREPNWTIKLGAYMPSSSSLRSDLGNTWYALDIDSGSRAAAGSQTVVYEYADTVFASKTVDDAEGDSASLSLSSGGVGFAIRTNLANSEEHSIVPYAGAGLGLYQNYATLLVNVPGESASGANSSTNLGYKLDAGIAFSNRVVLEADYSDAGPLGDVRLNGFSLLAGVKF